MKYRLTMQRQLRVTVEFEVTDENNAIDQAENLFGHATLNPGVFSGGKIEHDYHLCSENDETILDWNE